MLNGKGSGRGIPNAGYPAGTPSDYYMDRLWISLPWATDKSWPPYESTTVGGALRLANCLRVAAGKAGWGAKQLPPNTGMGIAVSAAEERQSPTWVAGIAEVTVDPKSGDYAINRITIAMDPGTVINPRGATAQVRGSALWGASQVMSERLTIQDGAFVQSNFHDYEPIRLANVPPIDVTLIDSGHHPSGVGEPGSTVVAPAVANAIFDAVGVRVRHMPIAAEAVLAGLKQKT
jgi:isoquinoline 1-oxidoreductase